MQPLNRYIDPVGPFFLSDATHLQAKKTVRLSKRDKNGDSRCCVACPQPFSPPPPSKKRRKEKRKGCLTNEDQIGGMRFIEKLTILFVLHRDFRWMLFFSSPII